MGSVVRSLMGRLARAGLFLVLCVITITPVTACCGHTTAIVAAPVVDARNLAERAEAKSVALLNPESGGAMCGGVWVSEYEVLSAFHCVKNLGRPVQAEDMLEQLLESLGMPGVAPLWDPTGQALQYMVKDGSKDVVVVERFDRNHDLALLRVKDPVKMPAHDVASVSMREIRDGDPVDVVGSTGGMPLTYSRCYVASVREPIPEAEGKGFKTVQLSGPVYAGNSGGPAFDSGGGLIGIDDFMKVDSNGPIPGMSFFVHRDIVKVFLAQK